MQVYFMIFTQGNNTSIGDVYRYEADVWRDGMRWVKDKLNDLGVSEYTFQRDHDIRTLRTWVEKYNELGKGVFTMIKKEIQ